MSKDRSERRTYRKSPGRQYGYEYDPLRSGSGREGREGERPTRSGEEKPGIQHTQRPNLRRTRQLLRQNILANKGRAAVDESEVVDTEELEPQAQYEQYAQHTPTYDEEEFTPPRNLTRNRPSQRPNLPATRELEPGIDDEEWQELQEIDPDIGYEDPLDERLDEGRAMPPRSAALHPSRDIQRMPTRSPERSVRPAPQEYQEYEDDDDYEYEDDEEYERPRPRRAKKRVSRRGMLLGLGAVAVGGAGVAAYELAPKIPQALNNATTNIEHQLQDAFNRGVAQGADAVRKEFITSLENLEGVSLDTAINAAALTRVAYDTFVSPIISFSANIAGDFLSTMLRAFRSARGFLVAAGQDNTTLASIQKVLESWVAQVTNMPKQLDAITDADLDGAQSYLNKLKNTLNAEKAKLNQSQSATPTAKPSGTPTK